MPSPITKESYGSQRAVRAFRYDDRGDKRRMR